MTDYTNDRWHVNGLYVTHDDFLGMGWRFASSDEARERGEHGRNSVHSMTHAARAWLAAQPKPTIRVGMRIEATLRGGAVVTGEVVAVTDCGNWTMIQVGPGVTCYIDVNLEYADSSDIIDWHGVTA